MVWSLPTVRAEMVPCAELEPQHMFVAFVLSSVNSSCKQLCFVATLSNRAVLFTGDVAERVADAVVAFAVLGR